MGIEIRKSARFDVSADTLWRILGDDFDRVGEWASAVDSSATNPDIAPIEGSDTGGRVCQAPGFGAINETLTAFDAGSRSYTFTATATRIPSFVRDITNRTTVRPVGPDSAEVEVRITADTRGVRGAAVKPVMTRKFATTIDGLFEDLRVFAKTGEVSEAKQSARAKAAV